VYGAAIAGQRLRDNVSEAEVFLTCDLEQNCEGMFFIIKTNLYITSICKLFEHRMIMKVG